MNLHDGDLSDNAVMNRYRRANERVIVNIDAVVFAALMDIPRLLEERKQLKKELEKALNEKTTNDQ